MRRRKSTKLSSKAGSRPSDRADRVDGGSLAEGRRVLKIEARAVQALVDRLDAQFAKAVDLAKANRAELVLVHVLAPIVPFVADGYVSPQVYDDLDKSARAAAQQQLAALVAKANKGGVRAKAVLRDGIAHEQIVRAARAHGLRVKALSLEPARLSQVPLPAIVHWNFNHFIVVERWSKRGVTVVDPALGRQRLTAAEFDAGFTGVVLVLEPGAHFERRRAAA